MIVIFFKRFIVLSVFFLSFIIFFSSSIYAVTFSISNPTSQGEEVAVDVSLSSLGSSSCPDNYCYLQGAFKAENGTRYFGSTKNDRGQWYDYDGSPEVDFIKSTFFIFSPTEGNWSGKIILKYNINDLNYKGPGNYSLKIWRYSGNSSSYSGDSDNTLIVNLVGSAPTPTFSPTPTQKPTSTPIPTPTPKPTLSSAPTSTTKPVVSIPPTVKEIASPTLFDENDNQLDDESDIIAESVLGASDSSSAKVSTSSVKPEKRVLSASQNNLPKIFFGIGIVFLIACGILGFRAYQKSKMENQE